MQDAGEDHSPAAKTLHWLVAVLVFALIPIGVTMTDMGPGPTQDALFVLHESFGLSLLALMALRLGIRLRGTPPSPFFLSPAERIVSKNVHHALYALLFATPVFGWLALSAYGLGPAFFGLGHLPPLLAKDEPLSKILFSIHRLGAFLIASLVLFHIGGALRHALIKRDALVWRMLPKGWRR